MNFIAHLIWHFKKMYLIRKVLVLVGIAFFSYALYSLFNTGWTWPEHRGTWLIGAGSFFVILSQFLSHIYDMKKEATESKNTQH
jgi:hypothetical protein